MKISRRDVLIGGAASLVAVSACARTQQSQEIVIGALYPLSGASAAVGVDARHALETAVDVINTSIDLDLPLAKSAGLAGFHGAQVKVVYADHQGDPQKGRAEAERLITQRNVAALIGVYHSSVAATVSQTAERYAIPFLSADNSSPSLHRRGLKFFFRATAHDETSGGSGAGIDLIIYGLLIIMISLAQPQGLVSLFPRRKLPALTG